MTMINKLNLAPFKHFDNTEFTILYFVKPWGSRLFRVYSVPKSEKREELIQVLNTFCVRHKYGVWYFHQDAREDIAETLDHMDIEFGFAEPDEIKQAACN